LRGRRVTWLLGALHSGLLYAPSCVLAIGLPDPRDQIAHCQRVAFSRNGLKDAVEVGLVRHRGLVGLDLDKLLAAAYVLSVALEPAQHGSLLHRVRQARHHELAHS
jgi:hypothetical protein